MQAYHAGQPIGPYIQQPPYVPGQAYYGYPPYQPYAPLGPGQNQHAFPAGYPPDDYDRPRPTAPQPRSRPLNRRQSTAQPKELKGIMKKAPSSAGHGDPVGPPLSRHASRSNSVHRQRANSTTRPRMDMQPSFVPQHLFVALHGSDELRIEGIAYQSTIEDMREQILPFWGLGIVLEEGREHRWRAQFVGHPWSSSGLQGIFARRLINLLYSVLARQGYNYISTVNTSGSPCRLVFAEGPPDGMAYIMSVCFSHSGDKISVLDAPEELAQNLGRNLRVVFPHKVSSDRFEEDGVYIVQMKRGITGSDVDRTLLAAYVLHYLNSAGFQLNGSIPMGRRSASLNLNSKKELWIFRGMARRPPSSASHR
ncbi:hypothetical protein K474DRAFT_1663486 [Panus rudis PR-1116 ss-1]|nr:hypothetical protein K474DRAFT_1663486 [Panus rudis PR-1116 ss-1]